MEVSGSGFYLSPCIRKKLPVAGSVDFVFRVFNGRGCIEKSFQYTLFHFRKKYMSVVIVGGHDRMVHQYKKICKEYKCKAKVFTQMSGNLSEKIGSPDLLILFTNTVSHKMVHCAVTEAEKCNAQIVRCHTSSGNALNEILQNACTA